MEKQPVLKEGFEVKPAANGGFIVMGGGKLHGEYSDLIADFSNGHALVAWLQYEVRLVEGVPVNAGSITATRSQGSPTIADEGWPYKRAEA